MNLATYPLTASMINQLNRVDVISNNLANSKTVGYKEENVIQGSFNEYLTRAKNEAGLDHDLSKVYNTIPKIDNKFADTTVGNLVSTGNTLDFGIKQKDLYFKVQDENGQVFLTRDGVFSNKNNVLVTKNNYKVLDINDQPVAIDNQNAFAANIGLFKTDSQNVQKVGNNNYKILDSNKVQSNITNETTLAQGATEMSNTNSIGSMVALIEAHRNFEQAQKAITSLSDLTTTLIDKIGSVK